MSDRPGRAIRCAQRAVLRTGSGPLRALWLGAYRMIIAITAAMLRYRSSGASVYARGSFGAAAHPVPGLSDIDLILVVPDSLDEPPGAVRRRILEPWLRVTSHLPWLRDLVTVGAFEDRELEDATRATLLTHGLDQAGGARALFAGRDPLRDHLTARAKPGIPAPMSDWRRVAGPERRPVCRPRPDDAWTAAWLDLQCWWRYAFRAAARPDEPHVTYLGVKLVAEPVRTLLWLRHGVSILSRRRALEQGLHLIAEEEDAIRSAILTWDRLHLGPESQLPERIAALLRLSCLVAREIAAAARQRASTAVSLLTDAGEATEPSGARSAKTALLNRFPDITARIAPVCDWRALCVPGDPEETMVLASGACASDPTVLASLGSVERPGVVPALSAADVIVEPTLDYRPRPILRGVLRAVQCRQSDPVTFSLLAGEPVAMFPGIPGWSAWDTARRAVAEYGARLAEADDDCNLNTLLAAARASLYLETLSHGEPRLAVDGAAVCSELVRQRHTTATMGMAACEAWRAQRTLGADPEAGLIRELSVAVRKLSFNAASPDVQRCTLTTG